MSQYPFIISPVNEEEAQSLPEFIKKNSSQIHKQLEESGALLFRGFSVKDAESFEKVSKAGTPNLLENTGGGSPRTLIQGKVYTSTEYSEDQWIPLHCEQSYFSSMPNYIWFFCLIPPKEQGQTPIGDMQELLTRLDPKLVERFQEKGVRYIYNLHGGKGFSVGWQKAFLTEDKQQVTDWLDEQGADYKWNSDNSLSIKLLAPGLRNHSSTNELVWGNQAVNWHVDTFPAQMKKMIRSVYRSEENYPKHAMFGDGSPIDETDIQHILKVQADMEVTFDWQQGDVLWCDNQRMAHGRRPFQGSRKILVALA